MLLGRLKDLFSLNRGRSDRLHLAAAALLAEAARLDGSVDDVERARIVSLLQERFAVTEAEATALLADALETVEGAVDLYGFTREINAALSPEERLGVIEMLWEVAYADGRLHDYEANLVRRVCGLLFVSDRDSGEARKRALATLGLGEGLA